MKVNVYVDGFNLYYRALKDPRAPDGTTYKWLDLGKTFWPLALASRLASLGLRPAKETP